MPMLLDLVRRQGHWWFEQLNPFLRRQRSAEQPGHDDEEFGLRDDAGDTQKDGP
jgi:hypothetical protein